MTDAFEEGDEQTVSFDEYIKGVEEQELEVDLVLGGDEGNECTYNKGYMKRQAIFSCLTCTPDGNAGVCTACSLSCHDGHEILELWTKRNFRCDCGNSKFGEFFCKLSPNKDIENVSNSYNHNFKGSYCTCDHPYPDPDAEEQVEMLQCCVCEDWFHEEHIGLESSDEIPRDEEGEPVYEDFICPACSSTCSFLTLYAESIWASARLCEESLNDVEKNSVGEEPSENLGSQMDEIAEESSEKLGSKVEKGKGCDNSEDLSEGAVSLHGVGSGNCSRSDTACVIGVDLLEAQPILEKIRPMFLSKNWREKLCRCGKCSAFCRQKNIGFLLDREDSIAAYERMGKRKREENLEQQEGMVSTFLNKLGHIEKIEILSGIADLKDEIQSFMESYDSSKPVTAADVQQVFDNLAKKRRRQL